MIIATATLNPLKTKSDVTRAELVKNTIKKAIKYGYEIIVVDGGSPKEFVNELKNLGAKVYLQKSKGMGNSRREAIKHAYETGKDIIIWTEPEKETFIPEIKKIIKPIINGSAEIVMPRRKSLKSYPTIQQYGESIMNLVWKELTGLDFDIAFGPKAWRREISNYFLDYKGDYGDKWDSITIPVMDAIFDNKKIVSVNINYVHPKEQTKIEEHDLIFFNKRIEQLVNLTNAFEKHWNKRKEIYYPKST